MEGPDTTTLEKLSKCIDKRLRFWELFVQNAEKVVDKRKKMRYDRAIKCGQYAANIERGDSYGVFIFRRDSSQRKQMVR